VCGVETAVLKFGGFLEAQVLSRVLGGLQGGEMEIIHSFIRFRCNFISFKISIPQFIFIFKI